MNADSSLVSTWAEFEATIRIGLLPACNGSGSDQNSAACEVCGRMLAGDPLICTTGIPAPSMATPRMTNVGWSHSTVWPALAPGGDDTTMAGGEGGAGLGAGASTTGGATGAGAGGFTSAITPSKFISVM